MQELGIKDKIFGVELLEPLSIHGKPTTIPPLGKTEKVICGYDQGLGERMIVCENLDEMQDLYAAYARGGAISIYWYKGKDPGFVAAL